MVVLWTKKQESLVSRYTEHAIVANYLSSWYFTYFFIISESKPTVSTQYPSAQKWLPQYGLFLSSGNLLNTLIAVFPFRTPINFDIAILGDTFINRWTWSSWTLNSTISQFNLSDWIIIFLRTSSHILPFNTLYPLFQ